MSSLRSEVRDRDAERFFTASSVLIVAGKGGVGKTTVAGALGLAAARSDLRTLVVEIEGKRGLAALFGVDDLQYADVELAPGLWGRSLRADEAFVEYLGDKGLQRFSKRLAKLGVLDTVATTTPGLKDLILLGKIKQLEREGGFDLVIVDAPAAGHAITFLRSPRGLLDAVSTGPVHGQAADVDAMLTDPARCRVTLVTIPEETPVNELIDTAYRLEDEIGIKLGPVVVNGVWPPLTIAGDSDAATFYRERLGSQQAQLERLDGRLPLPQLRLPYRFTVQLDRSDVDALADEVLGALPSVPLP